MSNGKPERSETRIDAAPRTAGVSDESPLRAETHRYMATSEGRRFGSSFTGGSAESFTGPVEAITPVPGETNMRRFDQKKSPAALAKDSGHAFVDKTSPEGDKLFEARPEGDKSVPKINVQMQDLQNPDAVKPHFVVKEDGSVEMRGNPEALKSKDINIVLEREDGQLNPTVKQQRAADELVRYLSDRVRSQYPDAANGIELNDKDNAISAGTERANKLKPPEEQADMTPQTRAGIGEANRIGGSNGVNMPRESTDRIGSFNTRDVPRQLNESDKVAANKEAIAGLFKPDAKAPYETTRKHPDGGVRAGRYGFSGKQISNWLDSLDLGDPPDPAKIAELIKQGKLPKGFNAASVGKLKAMAEKMDKGEAPGKDEIKSTMPKDMQETMATSMVESYKQQLGDKPGEVTAAFMTGKPVGQLTEADMSNPASRQIADAGQKLYDVATARQQTDSSDGARVVGQVPTGQRREIIEKALEEINKYEAARGGKQIPATQANLSAINLIIQRESSWKADIVNNWDSNARKGTPSKGLMQTIGPTFNAHKIPGHDNILDPVDNIIAGARYAVKRYGSLQNVPGVKAVANGRAYRGY